MLSLLYIGEYRISCYILDDYCEARRIVSHSGEIVWEKARFGETKTVPFGSGLYNDLEELHSKIENAQAARAKL